MNIPNINTNVIDISSFRIGLNHPFSSTGFCFKSKIMEGGHEVQKQYI